MQKLKRKTNISCSNEFQIKKKLRIRIFINEKIFRVRMILFFFEKYIFRKIFNKKKFRVRMISFSHFRLCIRRDRRRI